MIKSVVEESNTIVGDELNEEMSQKTDVIDYMDENPDATNQEIADALGIKKNNVAGIKSLLRKQGGSVPRQRRKNTPKLSGTVAPTPEVESTECTVEDAYNNIEEHKKSPAEYFGYEVSNVVKEFSSIGKETFFETMEEEHDKYIGCAGAISTDQVHGLIIEEWLDLYQEAEGDGSVDIQDVLNWIMEDSYYKGVKGLSKDDLIEIINEL